MPKQTSERRAHGRHRVARRARISAEDEIFGLTCLIRDGTNEGCRIVSSHVADLPDRVVLKIDGVGGSIAGQIVWRDNRAAGVRFDEPVARPAPEEEGPAPETDRGEGAVRDVPPAAAE